MSEVLELYPWRLPAVVGAPPHRGIRPSLTPPPIDPPHSPTFDMELAEAFDDDPYSAKQGTDYWSESWLGEVVFIASPCKRESGGCFEPGWF